MPRNEPMLVLVTGLPGTGKTTLASAIARALGMVHLNTDVIRKDAGKLGQYSESDKEDVYQQLLERTSQALAGGNSVIVDGTFYKKSLRDRYTALAQEYGLPTKLILCCAAEGAVRERVSHKRPFTQADFFVYKKIKAIFEPPATEHLEIHTDREELDQSVKKVMEYLKK